MKKTATLYPQRSTNGASGIYCSLCSHLLKKLLVLCMALPMWASSQVHEYLFDNNFNSSSGGPALTEIVDCGAALGSFGPVTSVDPSGVCYNFNAFCFNASGGLQYPNPTNFIGNTYTINMYVRFNSVVGWTRLIDFRNATNDGGFYIFGGCMQGVPFQQPIGVCPAFQPNRFYLITVTRDAVTFAISIYANGVLIGTSSDGNGFWIKPTTVINFFRDDAQAPCEANAGCIAYLSLSPTIATAAEIATLWSNIPTIIQASVSVPPNVTVTPSSGTVTCSTPNITLNATGGGTYRWSTNATSSSIIVDTASTYRVTVTDVNGCTAEASSIITKNITPPSATITPSSGTLTCAATTVALTAGGGASYNWGGGITTAIRTVSATGNYTVTVTGTNGCTATATASVGQNITPPTAAVNPTSASLTCTTTTATLTASGGTGYNWGGGITTATNTVSAPNTYTVTVTGSNGCTATASATVSQNITPPTATINPASTTLTCATTSTTLTASGGTGYNWGGGITTAANTVSTPNTYTVTVTGTNGCTATASANVTQNTTPPVAAISPTTATLTCGSATTTLTASGGGTYDWGGGITTATNNVSTANTYTVTVTGTNGCTATASAVVNQNINAPVASVSPTSFQLTCTNPSVTLTATGGGTYNWSGGITTAANTVNSPGTYTVTVTGANGCTATAQAVVTQDIATPAATVNPSSATLNCTTASVTLTAGGGGTYNWGGGTTTTTNTVSAPNTYTVTVTGANGCTATAQAVVIQDITTPAATITPASATLTCATTSATLTASGGASYNWGGGVTTAANTVTAPNTYTVTVTGTNGCTATASAVVNQTTTPPVATVNPATADITCITSSVTITATGGGTYNWGGGNTTNTNTANSAGTYTVTVTDGNGCTATASSVISQNTTPPTAGITPANAQLTCATTLFTLTATGGGTYDWGGGVTTATQNVTTPNTYTVTVTGTNGCTATASAAVTQDITTPAATVNPTNATITCTVPSVTITASGGASYDWGGGITTAANTVTAPNTYTVTVTGANGCTATAAAVIGQNITVPVAAISPASAILDCNNTQFTLTASGGASYDWGGGNTTANRTVSQPNTYTVTVTDASGCTATASSVVTQDITPPTATVTPTSASLNCVTSSVVLTVGGGGTYNWGGGNTSTTSTATAAGNYTVTVTGNNGCTATASSAVVDDFTPPTATVNPTTGTLTCTTTTLAITAGGGASYDWGGGITTAANSVTTPNTYTVTVTGANGCTATASAVINQDITPPTATVTPATALLTCAATSFNLTAAGAASYNWGGGINTAVNTVSTPNTYTVTATGANGCTATAASTVTQDITTPNVSVVNGTTLTCAALTSTLQASSTTANATFNWGGGVTTASHTISAPGNYAVTVTDPVNSCTATATGSVAQNITAPNLSLANSGTINCVNTTVTITATSTTPNVTYDWGGGNTTTTNTVTTAGSYSITVTDPGNSCTATAANTVIQDIAAPPVTIAPLQQLNCINNSVTITASSTVATATYDWGGGTTTATNTVTVAGPYTVTVTNPGNGCTATATANVVQNTTIPTVSIPTPDTITCFMPVVTLTTTTSAVIPAYNWAGTGTAATYQVSVAGTYDLTVTDNDNGCSASATTTVADIPLMNLTETHTDVNCFGGSDGTIDVTVTGGQQPLTYLWSTSAATEDVTGLNAATHTITVTDDIGCTVSLAVQIAQPASMIISETHDNVTCYSYNNGSIDVSVSAGMPPYSYRWNDNDLNEDRTNLAPGTYSVTVTDDNSCSVSVDAVITEPAAVTIQPAIDLPTCASNGNDGSISVAVAGGTTPYSYSWSNNATTDVNSNLGEGNYSVTVTDANSCTLTDSYQLTYEYDFVVDASPTTVIKLGESTTIGYTLTGNTGTITSLWTPDYALGCTDCATVPAAPVYTTLYTITITNQEGCVSTDTVSVIVNQVYEVFVPNAFTPNGDGVNDEFGIYGNLNGVEYMEIKVFNRIGEKVFESNNHNFTWDGTYQGQKLQPQVLTWQMKLTWMNGHRDELRKGTVTMFK